jgi:DnaJ-class molecular chaperone
MYCSSCGQQLGYDWRFCAYCGSPIQAAAAVPDKKACFECGGSGKAHRGPMPHSANCIFCQTCPGCSGTGIIPGAANVCPKCNGKGTCHDSPMPHNPSGCMFCTECGTCSSKGWI